jgi:hypothetical protein
MLPSQATLSTQALEQPTVDPDDSEAQRQLEEARRLAEAAGKRTQPILASQAVLIKRALVMPAVDPDSSKARRQLEEARRLVEAADT